MLYSQPVKQAMKRGKIYDVNERDPVSIAIELLDKYNISALPVKSNEGKYTGVISKSDIASIRFLKALQAKRTPESILIREIMNQTPPVFVMETDPVHQAIALMHKRHIHRLFVADKDYQLTGVISTSDILRLLVLAT